MIHTGSRNFPHPSDLTPFLDVSSFWVSSKEESCSHYCPHQIRDDFLLILAYHSIFPLRVAANSLIET